MKRKFIAAPIAALTLLAIALPASADTDVPGFADATIAVEQGNQAYYNFLIANATNQVTCRSEKPVFASQPEIDGRVTIKGEDTAASAITCFDAMLSARENISGLLTIEWLPEGGDPYNRYDWQLAPGGSTDVSGRMVSGVGTAVGVIDVLYPALHESAGRPHQACIEVFEPYYMPRQCTAFITLETTTV